MNRRAEPDGLMPVRDNEGYLLDPRDWRPEDAGMRKPLKLMLDV